MSILIDIDIVAVYRVLVSIHRYNIDYRNVVVLLACSTYVQSVPSKCQYGNRVSSLIV